jgi:hypothetical protein
VGTCAANGGMLDNLACVIGCFNNDTQTAGVALRDVVCVYSACGPACTGP